MCAQHLQERGALDGLDGEEGGDADHGCAAVEQLNVRGQRARGLLRQVGTKASQSNPLSVPVLPGSQVSQSHLYICPRGTIGYCIREEEGRRGGGGDKGHDFACGPTSLLAM